MERNLGTMNESLRAQLHIAEDSFRPENVEKLRPLNGRYVKGSLLGKGGFATCY